MTSSAWKALAALVVAACAAVGGVANLINDPQDDVDAWVSRDMPQEQDYSFVALPESPPPGEALIETSHYQDPTRDGQVLLFRYPDFTLYACSSITAISHPRACAAGDRDLLRSEEAEGIATSFSIGTKVGPVGNAQGIAVRAWVEESRLTTAPDWVSSYAREQLARIYQG